MPVRITWHGKLLECGGLNWSIFGVNEEKSKYGYNTVEWNIFFSE